jgi:3-dehydroquinate dehydratase-2
VTAFQSNHEGAIIDRIQAAAGDCDGIVINAGALTHYSYAVYDALVAVGIPTVEVHISNIHSREEWRRRSVIQPACLLQISGEGLDGYRRALEILAEGAGG